MKKKISQLIYFTGYVFGRIIPVVLGLNLKQIRLFFFSGFMASRFGVCGNGLWCSGKIKILNPKFIKLGDRVNLCSGVRLEAICSHNGMSFSPKFKIGSDVSINDNTHIGCSNKIHIGNNVLIAGGVFISDHYHGRIQAVDLHESPSQRKLYSAGPIIIDDDVWLGEGVCVMPNVRIGKGAIVGANAVVTRDVPPFSVAAGVPARIIKNLNS
jgi:acetyltransferase-like isoleucine patch superfamily enzyme